MNFRGVENKARLAIALFVVALLLTIGLSLALYWEARAELASQRLRELKLEAALLASALIPEAPLPTDDSLRANLQRNNVLAAAAVYTADGKRLAVASTIDNAAALERLSLRVRPFDPASNRSANPAVVDAPAVEARSEGGFGVAEASMPTAALVIARPIGDTSSPFIFYLFSYNIVAIVLGLGLLLLLARWLLKPYRRMVEAAQGSPIRAGGELSESEFVAKTFQALIERLQADERELAQLHALERKRAERSERFSERLISNIPSGLITIDSKGMVTSANAYARNLFGFVQTKDLPDLAASLESGSPSLAIDHRDFLQASPALTEMVCECLAQGKSFRRQEADVIKSDGKIRHLGLSISPITDSSHNVEGALCLMTDITEVIELRERMKLQESLANLGEMAAGLAHEFKNSLATIQGYIQLLGAQLKTAAAHEGREQALEATLNEVRLLARLVTDFLNFARPQHLNLSEVSLAQVIKDCADEVRPQLAQSGITLRVKGDFASLAGDESMLRRVFVNLMRNAAEAIDSAAPDKLVEVTGSIDSGSEAYYAHIRVRDTGSGISPEDLHRIFIPFFTTKSRGYGIGLAIVQKILIAHGGDVSVERSDNSGTTFHCRLPLALS